MRSWHADRRHEPIDVEYVLGELVLDEAQLGASLLEPRLGHMIVMEVFNNS